MKSAEKQSRNSNVELLRIIAMVMIVCHHYAYYGGFKYNVEILSFNRAWYQLLLMGGKIGANIFTMISAWFLTELKDIPYKKLKSFWCQVSFYSIVLFLIVYLIDSAATDSIMKAAFPIIFEQWWYASVYFILLLLASFLNGALASLNQKELKKLLVLLTTGWSIIPTLSGKRLQSNELLWMIYLYILIAYIRKYDVIDTAKRKKYFIMACFFYTFTYTSAICFDAIGTIVPVFGRKAEHFYDIQSLSVLGASLFSVLYVMSKEKKIVPVINKVAKLTFGVYLIHDNSNIRRLLWNVVFKNANFANSIWLPFVSLGSIAVVFIACSIIEHTRQRYFEKAYLRLVNMICDMIRRYTSYALRRTNNEQ